MSILFYSVLFILCYPAVSKSLKEVMKGRYVDMLTRIDMREV